MHPVERELRQELPQAVLRAMKRGGKTPQQIAELSSLRVDDVKRSIKRLVFIGAIKPLPEGAATGYMLTPTGASVVVALTVSAVIQAKSRNAPPVAASFFTPAECAKWVKENTYQNRQTGRFYFGSASAADKPIDDEFGPAYYGSISMMYEAKVALHDWRLAEGERLERDIATRFPKLKNFAHNIKVYVGNPSSNWDHVFWGVDDLEAFVPQLRKGLRDSERVGVDQKFQNQLADELVEIAAAIRRFEAEMDASREDAQQILMRVMKKVVSRVPAPVDFGD